MKTRKLVFSLVALILMFTVSCKKEVDYNYKWKLEVTYTNGDKDTMNCEYKSYCGNNCEIELVTYEPGFFSGTSVTPYLIMDKEYDGVDILATGVRTYRILSLEKTPKYQSTKNCN